VRDRVVSNRVDRNRVLRSRLVRKQVVMDRVLRSRLLRYRLDNRRLARNPVVATTRLVTSPVPRSRLVTTRLVRNRLFNRRLASRRLRLRGLREAHNGARDDRPSTLEALAGYRRVHAGGSGKVVATGGGLGAGLRAGSAAALVTALATDGAIGTWGAGSAVQSHAAVAVYSHVDANHGRAYRAIRTSRKRRVVMAFSQVGEILNPGLPVPNRRGDSVTHTSR
jgi:hypothetical protein